MAEKEAGGGRFSDSGGGTWSDTGGGIFGDDVGVPTTIAPPVIAGQVTVGQTISCSTGTWTGNPTSYTFQWGHCDSDGNDWSDINGATSSLYTPVAGDRTLYLAARVQATNAYGQSAVVQAAAVGPVADVLGAIMLLCLWRRRTRR